MNAPLPKARLEPFTPAQIEELRASLRDRVERFHRPVVGRNPALERVTDTHA
jgi:hypothetical protein